MKANETNPPKPAPKAPSTKEKPKDDSAKAIADLGTKLGLAAMPLVGLAAGGKTPNVNVIVIVNK